MKLLIILSVLVTTAYSYNILCVFPLPSRSHNLLGWGVVNALIKAGHEVTWATPYPELVEKNVTKCHLTVIDVSCTRKYTKAGNSMKPLSHSFFEHLSFEKSIGHNVTRDVITTPALQDALVTTQYDAVFTPTFYFDIFAGLAAVQQVPWLLVSMTPVNPFLEAMVDEVRSVPLVPILNSDYSIPVNFNTRLVNTISYVFITLTQWFHGNYANNFYNTLFEPLAKARGVPLTTFDEAWSNVSILFMNSHESITPALSRPPNVINVAGFHIDEKIPPLPKLEVLDSYSRWHKANFFNRNVSMLFVNSPKSHTLAFILSLNVPTVLGIINKEVPLLPKGLQELLDASPQGVIYFNMGTVIGSSQFPMHTRDALLRYFARMNQTVLWKYEAGFKDLPPNVHLRRWVPQTSVLAHPNVRVFITHGGLLSSMEAIWAGVPTLVVPVFGDQTINAKRAVMAGYARRVQFSKYMANELIANLKEMLRNNTYRKRVKEISMLFRSRPVSSAKLIAYYTELAVKTKGAYHLRSISNQYAWYQRWMVDQIVSCILGIIIVVIIVLCMFRFWIRIFKFKKTVVQKTTGQKMSITQDKSKKKNN